MTVPPIFVIREDTLGPFILAALRGRIPLVLAIRPILPPFGKIGERVVAALVARGRAVDMRATLAGGGLVISDHVTFRRTEDPWGQAEPWIAQRYRFGDVQDELGDYPLPLKHITATATDTTAYLVRCLRQMVDQVPDLSVRGLDSETLALYRHTFNDLPAGFRSGVNFRAVVNPLVAAIMAAISLVWIASRTRLRPRVEADCFLGIDYVNDPRDEILRDELSDGPGRIMYVARSKGQALTAKYLGNAPWCTVSDGRFTPGGAVSAIATAWRDIWRLLIRRHDLDPPLFWQLAKLPFKRMLYRSLFTRYRFVNFWGRDDYNPEHILRSQELRRIGGRHFGRMHGLPAYPPVLPHVRHIDFDVYYLFGEDFSRLYRDTWPPSMQVRASGGFGMSREQWRRAGESRPSNIIYYYKPSFQEDLVFDGIVTISHAFPDRQIIIKPKYRMTKNPVRAKLDDVIARGAGNIVESYEDPNEVMFKAQYALSDPSSTVVECMQIGMVSFATKFDPRWNNLYFDQFPDLCVTSAEQFIARVRGIEDGSWRYPIEAYNGLVYMGPVVCWDMIRMDMGLPPREIAPE